MSARRTTLAPRSEAATRRLLRYAIERDLRVRLSYGTIDRTASPYELRPVRRGWGGRWVEPDLVAYDHERGEYRTYKLAAIAACALVGQPRRPPETA